MTDMAIGTDEVFAPYRGRVLEDMIIDLLKKVDTMGTTALVKQNYGYSTTEAVKFVEKLSGS